MIITFSGHSFISSKNKIKEVVNEIVLSNISNQESVICYLGGYGDFDEICATACREIKKEHPKLQLIYVTPYLKKIINIYECLTQ